MSCINVCKFTVNPEAFLCPPPPNIVATLLTSDNSLILRNEQITFISWVIKYIKDRDLWNWKLPYSREISEALAFLIKPNDINSFRDNAFIGITALKEIGSTLLKKKNQQVQSKLSKVRDLTLCDIEFKIINVTENISELGNEICIEYNKPALMYFITQDMKVICSLRSINELSDVSKVATIFGGGGHRNASGFTVNLQTFMQDILKI